MNNPRSFLSRPLDLAVRNLPTQSAIAQRAQGIWQQEGRPVNQDLAIWLTAEKQVANLHNRRLPTIGDRLRGGHRSVRKHRSATSM